MDDQRGSDGKHRCCSEHQRAPSPVDPHGFRPDRVQQAAHSADPRQLGTGPVGGTPPEEPADTAAPVLLGSGSAEGRSTEIGATADQDRHRPGRQDHVDDRQVVELSASNPLEAAAMPSMRGFQMPAARTAMLHSGCTQPDRQSLVQQAWRRRWRAGRQDHFGPMILSGRAEQWLALTQPESALTAPGASSITSR